MNPYSRTRNKQTVRVLRIVSLLQQGYWSTSGLAKKLGVSPSTALRDMNALRHARIVMRDDGVRRAWTMKDA